MDVPRPDNPGDTTAFLSRAPESKAGAGRFVLKRILGQGGMGVVWLAHDERLDDLVALKFLPPQLRFDGAGLTALRRETLRSRKLTHPNIVRIHDLHEPEGEDAFIAMEFVDGPALSALRLRQPHEIFPWPTLAPLVRQLCDALDYAHGEKVVHRDLKPGNLMLDGKGRLKLADFGVATVISDSLTRVSANLTSGTIAYMSPQQMNGGRPQPTDDIYSLGATLYELLSGTPPFHTGPIVHQVLKQEPMPIRERLSELELQNEIPPEVEAMIMACLAKQAEHRPQSARAVAEQIGLPAAPSNRFAPAAVLPEQEQRGDAALRGPIVAARRPYLAVIIVSCLLLGAGGWWLKTRMAKWAGEPEQIIFAEDFEKLGADNRPIGWMWPDPGKGETRDIKTETGNHLMEYTSEGGYTHPAVYRLSLNPEWRSLRVSVRVRTRNLSGSPNGPCGATMIVSFYDAGGKTVKEANPDYITTSADWTVLEKVIPVPESATGLAISPLLAWAKGIAEFDDIQVSVVEEGKK